MKLSSSRTWIRYASTLDPNGNRTQTIITGSAVANHTETAEYDEIDQLTTATYGPGDSVTYAYDENGNRLAQVSGGVTTNYAYDELDRLTATTGGFASTSAYDDNGNRTIVSYGSGGTDNFSYDWQNRLTSATVGGSTVGYAYTGDDLRVSRTESGVTESYLWDRLSALPTMVDDGTTQSVHGPTGVATEITGNSASSALPDGLGSVRAWADSSGAATSATDWDAWGMVRSSTGSVGLHGFTGERADPTTNLVYLRARDYSPGTARFVQPDPIQPNAAGTHGYNPYWYANNNPGTYADPTGMNALALGAVYGSAQVGIETAAGPGGSIGYRLALTGALRGVASALIIIGGFPAWVFAIVAIVLIVALAIYIHETWCQAHNCTLSALAGSVGGWVETVTTAGKTELKMGWSGMLTGAAAACALGSAFGPGVLPVPVAQGCNFSDPDCTIAIVQYLVGEAAEFAIDVADPTGISSGVFDYAYSAATGSRCTPPPTSGGDCSFSGDTGVLMADGSTSPIAEIEIGDWVLAADPETGERGLRQVTALWVHADQLVDLVIDGEAVTTTEDHPFWNASDQAWQRADELDRGEVVLTADGDRVAVEGIDWATRTGGIAYNLTVADLHTYFVVVGDEPVLVHNTCGKPSETLSRQRQGRHLKDSPLYNGGSYMDSLDDAETVLAEYHSGKAVVLGVTKNGHIVVKSPTITGHNVNVRHGFPDQETNVFLIKGTSSPSIIPTTPHWRPNGK